MLDVSGDANRGGPDGTGAEAAAAAAAPVDDDDRLSGSVFLPGDLENRDFSAPAVCCWVV